MSHVAVITPYYKENTATLQRCLRSVADQVQHSSVIHYLVADGEPRPDLIAGMPRVRHLILPHPHRDNGGTPRGVGALCALNEGASIACFLDADNFYLSNHVQSVVETFDAVGGDVVISEREIMPFGYETIRIADVEDARRKHIDTSCMAFSSAAAFLWPTWAMLPQALSAISDRVMASLFGSYQLRCSRTGQCTVVFESQYSEHFKLAGLPVPVVTHDSDIKQALEHYHPQQSFNRLRLWLTPHPGSNVSGPR